MLLYPQVKSLKIYDGKIDFRTGIRYVHQPITKKAKAAFGSPFVEVKQIEKANLTFELDRTLHIEGYRISVSQQGILVTYASEKGIFYAMKTLHQMCQQTQLVLPFLDIEDEPELLTRGYMLDISRNKIPQFDTLKYIIDLLANLKYNHFELYIEGLSFLYPSHEKLYTKGMTPLTPDEFKRLERYAKARMIDLVPCHNGLGHMTEWLTHYPELAIVPEGMYMWGAHRPPSTVNPLDDRSIKLVQSLYEDQIKCSKSNYFHMNLDEPYELGHGKTKEEAKRIGVGEIYLSYLSQLSKFLQKHKKTPLVWGDVLNHYPETIERLPKDIIFVDWGYDLDYPFHETLSRLKRLGVSFMAAPGTSSWNSITGRTTTMFENIRQACLHTKLNQGLGMLLTDWGDNGHLQMFPTSLPGMVYGALESWRGDLSNRQKVRTYIDSYIIKDSTQTAGQLLLDMGNYQTVEPFYSYNSTLIMHVVYAAEHLNPKDLEGSFFYQFRDHIYGKKENYQWIKDQIDLWDQRISKMRFRQQAGELIKSEMIVSLNMLKAFLFLIRMQAHDIGNTEFNIYKKWLKKEYPKLLEDFKQLWLVRNKKGKLDETMKPLYQLFELVKDIQLYDVARRNPALRKVTSLNRDRISYLN